MRERLRKKGFFADIITQTVEALRKSGFLDDTALAENLKREAFSRKMLSRNGAKQYMLSRGIPLPVIDTAIVDDERTDIENAKRLVEKKMKVLKNYGPEIIRRRLYNVLSRRGYASETIRTVLKDNIFYKEDI
ncbi:MAG: regulatory protein RecX [Thermodesulfovibrionales bacterium]|nr:regulatory protein RecX [Thermodesulfovibrionales bacterium]